MTAIIDNQVVSCLAEMERLQEKRIDELEAKLQSHHYTMHPVHRECEEQQI